MRSMKQSSASIHPPEPAPSGPRMPQGLLLLDGRLSEASPCAQRIDVLNPATGRLIATIPACTAADVDHAVMAAHRCFESQAWQSMRPLDRGRLLERLALLIEEHAEELAQLESLDSGKLLSVTRRVDIPFAIEALRYFAGWSSKIAGEYIALSPLVQDGASYRAYTERKPLGVVAGITPWNFPLGQAIQKLAPAIACGCTVVLKPSEETSLTTLRLGELIVEAGFPAGAVNIVTGFGHDAGAALVEHPLVRKISFTGSTATGQGIWAAAALTMKRVTLELGGKSPTIILADADLKRAVPGAAVAIFSNSGQICTAGSRLLIEAAVYDEVIAGVAEIARGLKLGAGGDPDAQIGPLISARQRERVAGLVRSGLDQGALALAGGDIVGKEGWFYKPTVLTNVSREMSVLREEIFGPVVCALRIDEPGQLVELANDTPYGLAASIWTRDLERAHLLAERIDVGTVWLNTHNVLDLAVPFGGRKLSGLGREFGSEAIHAYTESKAVCMRLDRGAMAGY